MACCGGGGGSSSSTQTIYTKNELPGWVNDAAKANYEEAKTLSQRAYPAYSGQRIAQLTPDQTGAIDMVRNAMGRWDVPLNQAMATASGVAGTSLPQADIQAYMNPHIQQVINTSVAEANRQGDIARQQLARQAGTASAWGGDRQAIMESELQRNTADNINRMVAGLYGDAYNQAVQAWNADQGRKLQASGLMADLAGAGQQLGFADANALLQMGGLQQAQEQANLDLGYGDFLAQWHHPIEMLNLRMSALNASPYNTSSMQTNSGFETPRPNTTAQILGGLGAFAGGLGMLGGMGGWF